MNNILDLSDKLKYELDFAVNDLNDRCLFQAAKWCAEALNGLYQNTSNDDNDFYSCEPIKDTTINDNNDKINHNLYSQNFINEKISPIEKNKYLLAKSYFNCKEYDRAAYCLKDSKSTKSLFLKLYSMYISGEKKREEEAEVILGPLDTNGNTNKQIKSIMQELYTYFLKNDNDNIRNLNKNHDTKKINKEFDKYNNKKINVDKISSDNKIDDAFLLYLYGVVLSQQKDYTNAIDAFIKSVSIFPYNWSCWQDLSMCVSSLEVLITVLNRLPSGIMKNIFEVFAKQELFQHSEELVAKFSLLEQIFPNFDFLKVQRAIICYHGLDYQTSENIFDSIIQTDPNRLDDMDTYSNILYIMERRAKLSFLAHLASQTDQFRPETCCIIANFYSLRSDHEKAVVYYRRALTLNRKCLSAWTLMGHEYVELKNSHAAIESYRRATDVNRRDFRAWYGLGQAYEVLEMHYYSLFYYQKAAALRPYDSRMWQALAACFDRLKRIPDAIKSYKRALSLIDELDPVSLYRLAILYEQQGDKITTAKYMRACVQSENGEKLNGGTTADLLQNKEEEVNQKLETQSHSQLQSTSVINASIMIASSDDTANNNNIDNSLMNTSLVPPRPSSINQANNFVTSPLEAAQARLWLARYEQERENWEEAYRYASEVVHLSQAELEEARAIMGESRAHIDSNSPGIIHFSNFNDNINNVNNDNSGQLLPRTRRSSRFRPSSP